ncbi:MAG TPA: bifunctional UDP-sugar hydrolase/5'-nucleotidase [Kiritimatiellia bacterium]|nr:bifunctional UDP-sugar hydrolase/5'-nucleotidase [Kiritimatiellia bacterium]
MPSVSPTNSSRSPEPRLRPLLACAVAFGLSVLSASGRPVEITVLHTTDLHGHVLPTTDYTGRRDVGGILKCATLIRQIRARQPNALLVDCGDLYQGAPESYLTDGRIMIRALDWLKYDAWALGNHEFDWGLEKMGRLHDVSGTPMIAANITARAGRPHPFPRVRPYVVREVDGVKVVIVGLITPGVPTWSTPDLLGDSLFERSVIALKRIMPAVRAEEPDVLLLATHQGYKRQGDDHANEINAIVKAFPEFDAIIGGHSHQPIPEAWVDGRVLYTQAGYFGAWLGQLDLTYDTVARRVTRKSARLHDVDASVPRDAELEALLAADLKRAEAYLARPVGRAASLIPWKPDEFGNSPIQRLLARAIAAASGAEIVLHGVLDEQDLFEGELRMADIWRIVPYENRVAVLQVTPAELLEIVLENAGVRSAHSFMGLYGARYEWAAGGEGRRPINLVVADGRPPHPRKRLALAVNSYAVASGGGRYKRLREIAERPETRMRILPIDTRTAVLEYVKKHSPLDALRLMEEP